ncbi:hypothetical protein M2155_002020 [Streptomyces sp. SAI-119]|uniref:hypothetical protein n=1 Tax=Streptomyces sp. SAI-119 TaxID=2940541 RepID=UPI002474652D|nr:hypothetical protein [Streptomyces sp. SAI-119]MDH6449612.1 hypothetical protein [Streptomyces sp. SAI-119]
MPPRTMLPPNMTRHFYETRRAFLQSAGQDSTPWFQLSPLERGVVESEMEIFRQSIRRAEEEQDLLASLDATRAAAVEEPAAEETSEPAAADEDAEEECCLGCAAVAAVLALLEGMMSQNPKPSAEAPVTNRFPFSVAEVTTIPLDTRPWGVPLSEEEKARVKAAEGKLPAWLMTAGIDLDVLDGTAPRIPVTLDARPISVERLLMMDRIPFDDVRAEFWRKKPPAADKA